MSLKRNAWLLLTGVFLLLLAIPGHAVIEVQADAVTRGHLINASDTSGLILSDPTLGDPLANLRAEALFDGGIKAYGELYLGKNAPRDDSVELGSFYGSTGNHLSPFTARFGRFEVPFGTQRNYRSDHAQVQENPLIGNPLVDPTDHQLGGELSGNHDRFRWNLALTNGTDGSTASRDRGFGSALKVTYEPFHLEPLEISLSGYRSYHGDTPPNTSSNTVTTDNLFGAGEGEGSGPLSSLQSKHSSPLPFVESGLGLQPDALTIGRNVAAWQLDVQLDLLGTWRARYGTLRDDLSNLNLSGSSSEKVEWNYSSLEGKHPVDEYGYLAWRWDRLDARSVKDAVAVGRGITSNGEFNRYEIGWGRQFTNNIRGKVSYLQGRETLTDDRLEFEGFSFEVSLTGYPKLSPKNLSLSEENVSERKITN